ncbi:MAG: HDIG domain-containing protein [Leptolyngbya sp. PLA1]|nr:HDIG domain-containing protein [Leptolyngbya sp. PLA1]
MSKFPGQPESRVADVARSVRARGRVRARLTALWTGALDAMASPSLGWGMLIAVVFVVVCTATAWWTRGQPLVAVGRTMDETRLVRSEIVTVDEAQTQAKREAARQATPRVYVADLSVIEAMVQSLENLPRTLGAAETLDAVDPTIREQFRLTPEQLTAIRAEFSDGQVSASWKARVRTLAGMLHRRPVLDQQTWQRGTQEGTAPTIRLVVDGRVMQPVLRGEAINVDDAAAMNAAMQVIARDSGFSEPLRSMVVARLTVGAKPTFTFDSAATTAEQNAAAEATPASISINPVGQVIFRRGDVLSEAQATLNRAELALTERQTPPQTKLLRVVGTAGGVTGVALALAGYTLLFCPRIRRNAGRIAGVAGVLAMLMVVACFTTAAAPHWAALTTIAPTILLAILMSIAYDRRAALAYSLLHGLLVCMALRESVGTMAVMVTGVACVGWSLREIRDRTALLRSSAITALGVGLATLVAGLLDRPISPETIVEMLTDAARAAGGMIALGAAVLMALPFIERAFNVTTGMSLQDLRDPAQPLLRELQQRAPGTYTHSLNVATICEAAAQAIGADALLAYVGALYHDIGKMNKPEYFVENQAGGPNKHDRLSPAMSLLIVVGHVKDGVELAREFRVPAPLIHFIEAHHGTTLVEYFYHRARRQAEQGDREAAVPDEFEYRYPGPKPRTREVAILMIADAVESACRAMPEPTPSRIDQLVRAISHKRLMDGQFDDCELTLRELSDITEAISRTVASMYHSRVAYPHEPEQEAVSV